MTDLVVRLPEPRGEIAPVFPPRGANDVLEYDRDQVAFGYLSCVKDPTAPVPGPNHSPAFRWGWVNALRDRTPSVDDGYDHIRCEVIASMRRVA